MLLSPMRVLSLSLSASLSVGKLLLTVVKRQKFEGAPIEVVEIARRLIKPRGIVRLGVGGGQILALNIKEPCGSDR